MNLWFRSAHIAVLVLVLAIFAACGAQTSGQTAASGEMLYVVYGGGTSVYAEDPSVQGIVGFHPGANPMAALSLPAGLPSQDHRFLVATRAQAGNTAIAVIDTRTGATRRSFSIPGTYSTAGTAYGDATMSANGRWLALRDLRASGTSIALIDIEAGVLLNVVHLAGDFMLDALSAGGAMMYLLQNLDNAQHHYYVRAYDLNARHLLDTIIVDKTALDETKMHGSALTRQIALNGTVDYTLYINPGTNSAFIHALPLADSASGPLFAHCIDLPVGQSGDLLRYYTLTLSADGTTLYAANAALGVVARVSVSGGGAAIYNDEVVAQQRFNLSTQSTSNPASAHNPLFNGAVLSTDQRTLYVAGAQGLWALDTATLRPRATYLSGASLTSVALTGAANTIYAVDPARGILALSLANGQTSPTVGYPAHALWGIAWTTP